MKLSIKTKGNATPRGKRKVFFTSHPGDFEPYFDMICEDIFKVQDCAIYFISDEELGTVEGSTEENLVLEEMNLFVIPVTYKLLTEPNRTMDEDFPYAREHHIPVLPIMMEKEIDEFYASRFDKLEYLNRMETDASSIGYENKLSQFLGAVLISDEMSARIRAAFEAYVFLSYRKKDRKYANELMRLIHRNPLCRNIAIWYDEYLVPGENFEDTIMAALEKSDVFTMVVTPNVMESGNYVLQNEYPEANKMGKTILPVEMVDTDAVKMAELFKGLPECLKGTGDEAFYQRILEMLAAKGKTMQKDDPEHNFLVGLAYLDGIDVEKDYQQGLELIRHAADAGLLEAMEKLGDIYERGIGCEVDYAKSREWLEKAVKCVEDLYGGESENALALKAKLAEVCAYLLDLDATRELTTFVYETQKKKLGEDHPDTLNALRALACFHTQAGNYKEALDLLEKVGTGLSKALGEEHLDTLEAYQNIASIYLYINDFKNCEESSTALYEKYRKILGEVHPNTIKLRTWIAYCRGVMGDYDKATELAEGIYADAKKYLKDDWILSVIISDLAEIYAWKSNFEKAHTMQQEAYDIIENLVGPDHPATLFELFKLGRMYDETGFIDKALEYYEKVYDRFVITYGKKHLSTLKVYGRLAYMYELKGDLEEALRMHKEAFEGMKELFGEEHVESILAIGYITTCYQKLGNYEKALEGATKAYELSKKVQGEETPLTLELFRDIVEAYYGLGQREKALELGIKAYEDIKKADGDEHLMTHVCHLYVGKYYGGVGEFDKAIEILEEELEKLGEMLTPEDCGLLPLKYFLVMAYEGKGGHEKAMTLGESLLEVDRRVLGNEHFETVKLEKKLAEMRKS